MTFSEKVFSLPAEAFISEKVCIRPIRDDGDDIKRCIKL